MAATVPVVAAASIDQRFAQLIQQFGLTKNSFAISLGKTASVVQHLIDGRNKPGFDLMCKVFEIYPNVSRDWLLLGRGPMLVGSNGAAIAPVAVPEPSASESEFEPIDLADVAPRAARRPAGNRLQPDEIGAALALATAAADGMPAATTSGAAPSSAVNALPTAPISSETITAASPPAAGAMPDAAPEIYVSSAPATTTQRPAQPFRPVPRQASESAAFIPNDASGPSILPAAEAPAISAAPVSSAPSELPSGSLQTTTGLGGPEAYVAAAIHAQHLQHQLALAELRNQHLLEQQQMLREMLAMARQSMV